MSRHDEATPDPFDLTVDWRSIVQFDDDRQCFVRYLDRNGEHVEEIRA